MQEIPASQKKHKILIQTSYCIDTVCPKTLLLLAYCKTVIFHVISYLPSDVIRIKANSAGVPINDPTAPAVIPIMRSKQL